MSLRLARYARRAARNEARATRALSSGERLYRAGNDPAGLAISTRLRARYRGSEQAIRNVGDGLSMVSVAEGALGGIADHLMRIRELAMEAANGTMSQDDRGSLDAEARARLDEIQRIADTTTFNGRRLLRQPVVEIGIIVDSSGSMGGELDTLRSVLTGFVREFTAAGVAAKVGLMEMNNKKAERQDGVDRLTDLGEDGLLEALNGIALTGTPMDPYSALLNASGIADLPGTAEPDAFSFTSDAHKHLIVISDAGREADFVPDDVDDSPEGIARALSDAGISVHVVGSPGQRGVFDQICRETGGGWYGLGDASGSGLPEAMHHISEHIRAVFGSVEDQYAIQAGPGRGQVIPVGLPLDASLDTLGLGDLEIGTRAGAERALGMVDLALELVDGHRAKLGGIMSRLQGAMSYLEASLAPLDAARSRIQDADFAEETSGLERARVVGQVAKDMLARAADAQARSTMTLLDAATRGGLSMYA